MQSRVSRIWPAKAKDLVVVLRSPHWPYGAWMNHHAHNDTDEIHAHSHGVADIHAPASFGTAFAVGIGLNLTIVILQAVYGVLGNSLALLADAGHNLADALGLVAAWLATALAKRPPSTRFSYGLKGSSILAALFNAVFLLVVMGGLSWEALRRLFEPEPVAGKTVMIVAAIGLVLNGVAAWLFASGRKGDINIRGAFLHMAADAGVSAGVVLAGLLIVLTGKFWIDPLVSLAVNAVIVWGTWNLLSESIAMTLSAVPSGVQPDDVRDFLATRPGVAGVHDLHIWPMSTTETALTAHLVVPAGHPGDAFLLDICEALRARFNIGHTTLQVETSGAACPLAPEHVV
jgi:cobalt-zinc-cadmium efflux system protein